MNPSSLFNNNRFKDSLQAFHPEMSQADHTAQDKPYGYLLFDFQLKKEWVFDDFVIEQSIKEPHGSSADKVNATFCSYVSPVLLPPWVNSHSSHLFLLGLSAVCSFCTGRAVMVPSDMSENPQGGFLPLEVALRAQDHRIDTFAGRPVLVSLKGEQKEGRIIYRITSGKCHRITIAMNWGDDSETLTVTYNDEGEIVQLASADHDIEAVEIYTFDNIEDVSLRNPIKIRGLKAASEVHADVQAKWYKDTSELLSKVWSLPYEEKKDDRLDYIKIMQAVRMVQLSNHVYHNDFDLSFSLLVAAIEAVAQIAVKATKLKAHPDYKQWAKLAEEDEAAASLLNLYREAYGKQLGERFRTFILKYLPMEEWDVMDERKLTYGRMGCYG